MAVAGMMKCFFNESELEDISPREIANALPSPSTTFAGIELKLAADLLATRIQEIIKDEAKYFALVTDMVREPAWSTLSNTTLVWEGKRGNETLRFHCIDVDASNHSGEDCANAVKKSLNIFTGQYDFEVICVTGDAGGGAAVQDVLPHLKRLRAFALY